MYICLYIHIQIGEFFKTLTIPHYTFYLFYMQTFVLAQCTWKHITAHSSNINIVCLQYFCFLLHVFLFSCLGSQKCNVYTIKENSISTTPNTTNQYTMTKPNKFKEPLLSPFSRSQSFNTYKRYQPNQENDLLYFRTNAQNYGYINGSKNTQSHSVSHNSTDMCIWDDKQSKNGHPIPFSTDCTNDRVSHTNTHTQFPKDSLSTTHINYVASPVKRSDSFCSGKIFMSNWFVKTYFRVKKL